MISGLFRLYMEMISAHHQVLGPRPFTCGSHAIFRSVPETCITALPHWLRRPQVYEEALDDEACMSLLYNPASDTQATFSVNAHFLVTISILPL